MGCFAYFPLLAFRFAKATYLLGWLFHLGAGHNAAVEEASSYPSASNKRGPQLSRRKGSRCFVIQGRYVFFTSSDFLLHALRLSVIRLLLGFGPALQEQCADISSQRPTAADGRQMSGCASHHVSPLMNIQVPAIRLWDAAGDAQMGICGGRRRETERGSTPSGRGRRRAFPALAAPRLDERLPI